MRNFFDLSYKKNLGGAILFYVFNFIAALFLAGLIGYFIGSKVSLEQSQIYGAWVGRVIALGLPIIYSLLILRAKQLLKDKTALIAAVLSVVGAVLGGVILGLIPVAFLTTRESMAKSSTRSRPRKKSRK